MLFYFGLIKCLCNYVLFSFFHLLVNTKYSYV